MTSEIDLGEVHDIGVTAYTYLYPLITMDLTRLQATNTDPSKKSGTGPMNTFVHIREFPDADWKMVVRPNFDTLYSSAWLDLTDGPLIVSAGEDTDGRYYELPMYDYWTDAFAVPGQRTTGVEAGNWAVTPPAWHGTLPDGVDRINSPTPYVWIIGRTQTNGPSDYATVGRFQDSFRISPLSQGQAISQVPIAIDPSVDTETPPLDQVNALPAKDFFDYALGLLTLHPPHATDWSLIAQMRRIGLTPGTKFASLPADIQAALADVPGDARQAMFEALPKIAKVINGWQMNIETMGVYGNSYVKRALVAMLGLGANSAEDAIYPLLMTDADGNPATGDNDYVLHFDEAELPPVHAFWSVTMYDGQGFQSANSIDRYAIGDRDSLTYNADGSLDLYLQHASPGPGKESNWLPAPTGPLGITMRLYSPKAKVLSGNWSPPPLRRA